MNWKLIRPGALDALGYIPQIIRDDDARSVQEQVNDRYSHGGGWNSFPGFAMLDNGDMQYGDPNDEDADPPTRLMAEGEIGKNKIRVYEHAWVAIVAPDGSFEVSRMD